MAVAAPIATEYGEVFTRRWVVDAILDLVGFTPDRDLARMRLLEPSVGSGAFMAPVIERLVASARRHGRSWPELTESLRGYDIQQASVLTCRGTVREVLHELGASTAEADNLAQAWVRPGDFLLEPNLPLADFVVGNPPYIRSEDLDDAVERAYRTRWTTMRGRADIYIGFIERSLSLLRPGGRLGMICADRWMRNAYGKPLRALVTSNYAVESVWQMHDVDAFETEVSAYPAITVLANREQGEATVLETSALFDSASVNDAVAFCLGHEQAGAGTGWQGARLPSWFETDDFWPAGPPRTIQLLEHLQEHFQPLESDPGTKIGIGIATGADKAFIIDGDQVFDVEADRLLPLVMADDIRSGSLRTPRKLMLNPWTATGELVDLKQYPRLAEELGRHTAVKNRFVARKNPEAWHRTIDKVAPGLAKKPKLLLQDMKAQITPVLEPGGYYPHHNLYYVTSTTWDLEVLGGLLLSRIAEAFISSYGVKMRGGTLRFQAQYLRKIVVPPPDEIDDETAQQLRAAFRAGDRAAATTAAEQAYHLEPGTLERTEI